MGKNSGSDISVILMAVIVVLVMAAASTGVNGQSIYSCWGGCYNECFLRSGKTRSEGYPCYVQCLSSCMPSNAADYARFCSIGCSLQVCVLLDDGSNKDQCFERCTNMCKI